MSRLNSMQAECTECVTDQRTGGFRRVAVAPFGHSNPVSQLSARMRRDDSNSNRPDDSIGLIQLADSERDSLAIVERVRTSRNP